MKKLRKGKKLLLILGIAVLAILAVVIIINIVNKQPSGPVTPEPEEEVVIPLPETTYSDMEVKNIEMVYLKDNNETMISMEIHNTTSNRVYDEDLYVTWIGPNESVLGKIQTYIEVLEVGEQYDISVILKGDLTATSQIKLEKKVKE